MWGNRAPSPLLRVRLLLLGGRAPLLGGGLLRLLGCRLLRLLLRGGRRELLEPGARLRRRVGLRVLLDELPEHGRRLILHVEPGHRLRCAEHRGRRALGAREVLGHAPEREQRLPEPLLAEEELAGAEPSLRRLRIRRPLARVLLVDLARDALLALLLLLLREGEHGRLVFLLREAGELLPRLVRVERALPLQRGEAGVGLGAQPADRPVELAEPVLRHLEIALHPRELLLELRERDAEVGAAPLRGLVELVDLGLDLADLLIDLLDPLPHRLALLLERPLLLDVLHLEPLDARLHLPPRLERHEAGGEREHEQRDERDARAAERTGRHRSTWNSSRRLRAQHSSVESLQTGFSLPKLTVSSFVATPRSERYLRADSARRAPSAMLYWVVPRSSAWPETVIFFAGARFTHSESFCREAWDSAPIVAWSNPKRIVNAAVSAHSGGTAPFCRSSSALRRAASAASSRRGTQRSASQRCPSGQSASFAHCGFGAHLFSRQTKPSLQSESAAHSWQRPSTQTFPKPCCSRQSWLDLHSPLLGFAGHPASVARAAVVTARSSTRRMSPPERDPARVRGRRLVWLPSEQVSKDFLPVRHPGRRG